jgi:hypothetical protein
MQGSASSYRCRINIHYDKAGRLIQYLMNAMQFFVQIDKLEITSNHSTDLLGLRLRCRSSREVITSKYSDEVAM